MASAKSIEDKDKDKKGKGQKDTKHEDKIRDLTVESLQRELASTKQHAESVVVQRLSLPYAVPMQYQAYTFTGTYAYTHLPLCIYPTLYPNVRPYFTQG